MARILMTTTPQLSGMEIEQYLGLVTANQVAGTGFMTDFTASFSDFFGGNSGAYREEMNRLYREVTESITNQVNKLGGNAVIGISVDYDSISAKNMSMFMVSIKGTAVKVKLQQNVKDFTASGVIDKEILETAVRKKMYIERLSNDLDLKESDWTFMLSHDMGELDSYLKKYHDKYVGKDGISTAEQNCMKYFPAYLSTIGYDRAVKIAYEGFVDVEMIKQLGLFNAKEIMALIKRDGVRAWAGQLAGLLLADKQSYNAADLADMKELATMLNSLPDEGKIEEVKGGIFSSGGMKFVCSCGHKNPEDNEYCEECGRNIKGLVRSDVRAVKQYQTKVETLEEILTKEI